MSSYISQASEYLNKFVPLWPNAKEVERIVIHEIPQIMPLKGGLLLRVAGLSGAIAVALGAYGAHVFRQSEAEENLKVAFEAGNRYHMLHTIALMAVPLTRRPNLVGTLMISGMVLFCGSCYYHSLTGSTAIRRVTPYGGMLLIAAWTAMAL